MSTTTSNLPDNYNSVNELTRRQALALLVTAPLALATLPAPVIPATGDPLADEAAYLTVIYIPCLEQLLANAKARLATLGGVNGQTLLQR